MNRCEYMAEGKPFCSWDAGVSLFSSLGSMFGSGAAAEGATAAGETAAATIPTTSALGNTLAAMGTADAGVGALAEAAPIAETTITGAPSAFGAAAGATPATLGWLTPENIMRGLSVGSALKSAIQPSASAPSSPTPTPSAQSVTPPSSAPSGVSPADYTKNETARWLQLLSGSGQLGPGGGLPQNIQDLINRQAALIH